MRSVHIWWNRIRSDSNR